ncbi:MAG: hypothetical protein ACI97B_004271, partial [Verrucomicrobiales bacterium]
WVYMFASYTEDCGAKEALQRTFDGANPCGFCAASESMAQSNGQPDQLAPLPLQFSGDYLGASGFSFHGRPQGMGLRLSTPACRYAFSKSDHTPRPG